MSKPEARMVPSQPENMGSEGGREKSWTLLSFQGKDPALNPHRLLPCQSRVTIQGEKS